MLPHPRLHRVLLSALLALGVIAPAVATAAPELGLAPTASGGLWLAGDLHVHTTFSHDSYGGPDDDNTGPEEAYTLGWRVGEQFANAAARGLDFLAITDHNDVRSQADDGFGTQGVIPIPAYENSLSGHAQMLGATEVYDKGDRSPAAVNDMAEALRANGGAFQINHPGGDDPSDPDALDWSYGYEVAPDSVEVWNISRLWQPPFPSGSSNDDAIGYWEGWLDRGHLPAVTGGSDNHYIATAGIQGVGQPTTWVYASDRSTQAVLDAIKAGRTSISFEPPNASPARIFLEADRDGDGTHEAMMGDTVVGGTPARVRVDGAAGATLALIFGGDADTVTIPVSTASFVHEFTVPAGATWVRAEAGMPDGAAERQTVCDPVIGGQTTYCRDDLAVVAMTSAMGVTSLPIPEGLSATVEGTTASLSNGLITRTFALDAFTSQMTDLRSGFSTDPAADFSLDLAGATTITSDQFAATDHAVFVTPNGGLALRFTLETTLPGHVTRTFTIYPGATLVEVDTELALPGSFTGYTLDAVGTAGGSATAHHFNAGYDWRGSDTPDWSPAVSPFGGEHTGDHRVTTTGDILDATGQWLSVDTGAGTQVFQVLQRVNYDSSHVAYDGTTARAHVDLADDLIYLGPFEADIHLDNPAPAPVRTRDVAPGETLPLERVVTGLATDDDDEAWQHFRYLRDHRWNGWQPTVTFNSNGVDGNRISTGAKDDMNMAETVRQADVARRLGVETFILDDGWQAASGDWCPDSPECPEPRTGMFPDRFPDAEFTAVRDAIAPMDLGLWMSPMHFNPGSDTYGEHPEWACSPLGDGLVVYNTLQPDTSSNEAGLGTWNAGNKNLIAHIEQRITRAIEVYGSTYFKFDFLAWIDCVGATDESSAYEYREAFVAMLDRLIAAHPGVTFQIDETNDYRLFPFESASRGPSWFANGNPTTDQALHNLWILSPFVPAQTIGQSTLGKHGSVDANYLMAIALTSHLTFFNDLTSYSPEQVAKTRRWIDVYTANRDRFTGVVYPLLADPIGGLAWTALQSWDPDAQSGALMAYRQQDPDATTTISLRGISGEASYELTDALTGQPVMTVTAQQLRDGIDVTLPSADTAAVWLIDPAA